MLDNHSTDLRSKWLWFILFGLIVFFPLLVKERAYAQGGTIPSTITVRKILQPSGDPGRFSLLVDNVAVATNAGDGDWGEMQLNQDTSAQHKISETAETGVNLDDYAANISCGSVTATSSSAATWTINVNPGDNVDCTITNVRKTGLLTVKNVVQPATDPGKFNLQIDGGNIVINTGNSGTSNAQVVNTGKHTVREVAGNATKLANYTTSIDCRNGGGSGNRVASTSNAGPLTVPVGDGDNIVCTFTNTKLPSKLQISKTDKGALATPGNNLSYTLQYTNTGGIARHVVITETVPAYTQFAGSANVWSCAVGDPAGTVCTHLVGPLDSAESGSVVFIVKVITPLPAGVTRLTNTAWIGDYDLANAKSANDTTAVNAAPLLTLHKDDGGVTAEPGKVIVYNLGYGNTGNQDAAGVAITETVPANTQFKPESSTPNWVCPAGGNAGARCTLIIGYVVGKTQNVVTFAVTLASSASNATEVVNTAWIGHNRNPNATSSTVVTPIKPPARLSLLKDDGGVSATPSETVVYTLTFTNRGNQVATGVILSETVPAYTTFAGNANDWSCKVGDAPGTVCQHSIGNLASGATGFVQFRVKVDPVLPAGVTQLSNVAHIGDGEIANVDTSSDATTLNAAPDLSLTEDDGGVVAKPGDTIIYTLHYANQGNRAATGVVIHETVPTNTLFAPNASTPGWNCVDRTCTYELSGLPGGGASGVIRFAVQVNTLLPVGINQLTNTAMIHDDGNNGNDLNPANNVATDTTPLSVAFALTATKQATLVVDVGGNQVVDPGDTLEYLVTLHNNGNSAVSNLNFQDPLDANIHLAPGMIVQTSQGTVISGNNASDRTVQVALGTLAAGADAQVRFRATVNNTVPGGVSEIVNQGVIKSNELADLLTDDPNVEGSHDATRTPLVTTLALRATLKDYLFADLDHDNKVSAGDLLLYRLTVSNVGNIGVTNLFVDDAPDPHSTLVVGTVHTDRGEVITGNAPGDTHVRVHLNSGLQSGESAIISFQVKIAQDINVTQLANQAQITVSEGGTQAIVLSDDPDTAQPEDATITPLGRPLPNLVGDKVYLPLLNKR